MKYKIIFIVTHFPPYQDWSDNNHIPKYNWKNNKNETFGFDGISWGDQMFNEFSKYAKNMFDFEVWQPDLKADQIRSVKYSNGIKHILFPVKFVYSRLFITGVFKEYFASGMDRLLEKYLNENQKILIHLFINYRYNSRFLLDKYYRKIPFVFQFATNSEKDYYFGTKPKITIKNIIKFSLFKNYYKKINNIIPASETNINNKVPSTKIYYRNGFSNVGININKIKNNKLIKEKSKDKYNINKNEILFFASQRILPSKQIDKLIDCFSRIDKNKYKLFISGSGTSEYISYLNNKINQNNLSENIKIVGYVSNAELLEFYIMSDYFISTSISEAGPHSIYKAIVLNIPIITTKTGIAYDFLRETKCGQFLNNNDDSDWSDIILKVIDNKITINIPKERDIINYFHWEKISNYYLDIYKKLINSFKM